MTATAADPTTTAGLHPLLADRRSTRAYDAGHVLGDDEVARLLEAARWSPSASNTQPWRFLVARRGTPAFERLFGVLAGGNQLWAGAASALVLGVAETRTAEGKEQAYAQYDLGQSVAHLTVQAQADGLDVHQMGGFDRAAAAAAFDLPERFSPVVVAAIGIHGPDVELPPALAERELAARTRKPLDELVIAA